MALSVTHAFVCAIADDPTAIAAGEMCPQTHWNANHTLTGQASYGQGGTGTNSFVAGQVIFAGASALGGDTGFTYAGAGKLTLALGSISANAIALNITATWNNAATRFDAPFLMNITDTASDALSSFLDIQQGGVSSLIFQQPGASTGYPTLSIGASATLSTSPGIPGSGLYVYKSVDDVHNPTVFHRGTMKWVSNFFNGSFVGGPAANDVLLIGSQNSSITGSPAAGIYFGNDRQARFFFGQSFDNTTPIPVTGAANNGSGAVRLTLGVTTQLVSFQTVTVAGVVGTTEANGHFTITAIDSTHIDLQGTTFVHAYVSGGTVVQDGSAGTFFLMDGGEGYATFANNGIFGFSNSNSPAGTGGANPGEQPDLFICREGPSIATWGNYQNQAIGFEHRIYNNRGNPDPFQLSLGWERGTVGWQTQANIFTIATGALTGGGLTGVNRDMAIAPATGILHRGLADAAAPVAQTEQAQSVVAGTSNTAGVDWTFIGSAGTGTGVGGAIVFKTAPAGGAGSTQNTPAEVLRILGAGNIKYSNAASFSANGAVATVLGSIGPTGSHTTVQTWLTFQDSGGVIRYVPCF